MYGADTNWEHFLFVFSTTVATLHPVVLQVRNGSSASPPEAGFVCCIVLAIRQFSRQLIVNCLLLCKSANAFRSRTNLFFIYFSRFSGLKNVFNVKNSALSFFFVV